MKLAKDVVSVFYGRIETVDPKAKGGVRVENGPIVYGKKGEEVTIIGDYNNVVIVENSIGKRYPVKKEDLNG